MTTGVDVEQIETTKGEKLLAVVLAVFVLTGVVWAYFDVDVERERVFACYQGCTDVAGGLARSELISDADNAALRRESRAGDRLYQAGVRVSQRRNAVTDHREAYRTALDEGRRDSTLERRYRTAQERYARAQDARREASRASAAARRAAAGAHRRLRAAERRTERRADAQQRHDDRVSLARRLGLVLGSLAAAYALLGHLRRRHSRYMLTAMAAVAAVAALSLVMAVDYLTDYVEVTEQGVLALSVGGVILTLVAFWWLQRYLARRLPERRVRKGECPFCGYPVRDEHCEGCGRDTVTACAACAAPRRVGTRRCGACGAA